MAYPTNLFLQGIRGQFGLSIPLSRTGIRWLFAFSNPAVGLHFHAFKSLDLGVTWTESDAANTPATPSTGLDWLTLHPTDSTRVCIVYTESGPTIGSPGDPLIIRVIEFSLTTGLWGPRYGGAFPWVNSSGTFRPPLTHCAIARAGIGDIVCLARTNLGPRERCQFATITPGAASWSPSVDAYPAADPADDVKGASITDPNRIAIGPAGHVYVLLWDDGPIPLHTRSELVQARLSPANAVGNVDVVSELDYKGSGGWQSAGNKIFLILDRGSIGPNAVDVSYCVDGADIAGFPNLLSVAGGETPALALISGQCWFNYFQDNLAFQPAYQALAPNTGAVVPTVAVPEALLNTVFPGITNIWDNAADLGGVAALVSGRQNYFEANIAPAPLAASPLKITLRGVRRVPSVTECDRDKPAPESPKIERAV